MQNGKIADNRAFAAFLDGRASGGVKVSLSEILKNQDVMLHSSFWQYDSNADGHNSEGLLQLLSGHIEPGDHFYWTLFNFGTCEVTGRMCWGPSRLSLSSMMNSTDSSAPIHMFQHLPPFVTCSIVDLVNWAKLRPILT